MTEKIYKFKNNKHSVIMRLVMEKDGICYLVNRDYPTLQYRSKPEDLEEVK